MTRSTRTSIVLAIAVVTATIASYGVYSAIERIPVREVEIATRFTVVAARPLTLGTRLQTSDVKLAPWPEASPVAGGFAAVGDVVDRGLLASVAENEPIVEAKIAPRAAGAGLPPSIPPGMRAMSVKVNEMIGVAGFVLPGTTVDVLVVMKQREDSVARVIVDRVLVLAAGTRYDQENANPDGKPIPSTVVTLVVTPEDGERIALAQAEGQIQLALRNPLDTNPTDSPGVRSASLVGQVQTGAATASSTPATVRRQAAPASARPSREASFGEASPPAAAAPAPYVVEAIRGTKRNQEVVTKHVPEAVR